MAFSLWNLFEATLLFINAVCILHEERFLAKMGWRTSQQVQGFGEPPSAKTQLISLMYSIRTVMRFPLIFINIVIIVVKLLLG